MEDQVTCDRCETSQPAPSGETCIFRCKTAKCNAVLLRRKSGIKYLMKECRGKQVFVSAQETAKWVNCSICQNQHEIGRKIVMKKCGMPVFSCLPYEDVITQLKNEVAQLVKRNDELKSEKAALYHDTTATSSSKIKQIKNLVAQLKSLKQTNEDLRKVNEIQRERIKRLEKEEDTDVTDKPCVSGNPPWESTALLGQEAIKPEPVDDEPRVKEEPPDYTEMEPSSSNGPSQPPPFDPLASNAPAVPPPVIRMEIVNTSRIRGIGSPTLAEDVEQFARQQSKGLNPFYDNIFPGEIVTCPICDTPQEFGKGQWSMVCTSEKCRNSNITLFASKNPRAKFLLTDCPHERSYQCVPTRYNFTICNAKKCEFTIGAPLWTTHNGNEIYGTRIQIHCQKRKRDSSESDSAEEKRMKLETECEVNLWG